MVRTRLALLTLAIGLTAASGCAFRSCQTVSTPQTDCACNENPYAGAGVAGFESGLEPGYDGPILMQPDGGYIPPPPTPTGPPPRIEPIPQANPIPYTPTGLRRLFSREPQ